MAYKRILNGQTEIKELVTYSDNTKQEVGTGQPGQALLSDGVNTYWGNVSTNGNESTPSPTWDRVTKSFVIDQSYINDNKGFIALTKDVEYELKFDYPIGTLIDGIQLFIHFDEEGVPNITDDLNYIYYPITLTTSTDTLDIYEISRDYLQSLIEKSGSIEIQPDTENPALYFIELNEVVNITSANINDFLPNNSGSGNLEPIKLNGNIYFGINFEIEDFEATDENIKQFWANKSAPISIGGYVFTPTAYFDDPEMFGGAIAVNYMCFVPNDQNQHDLSYNIMLIWGNDYCSLYMVQVAPLAVDGIEYSIQGFSDLATNSTGTLLYSMDELSSVNKFKLITSNGINAVLHKCSYVDIGAEYHNFILFAGNVYIPTQGFYNVYLEVNNNTGDVQYNYKAVLIS